MSTAAALAGQQVHAYTKHTHNRKRNVFYYIQYKLKRQQLFPVVAGLFRGRSPQGQVINVLPFILMKLAKFLYETASLFGINHRIFIQ